MSKTSWAKFDDLYDDNRKVKRAWRAHPRAVGLHAMAITYCCRHRTDGLVDLDWLAERLPVAKERGQVIAALVDVGLFEPADAEHWRVHDYLDYNPSSDEREAQSRGAKAAALARWGKRQSDPDSSPQCEAQSDPQSDPDSSPQCEAHAKRNATPVPSRPVPTRPRAAAACAPAHEAGSGGGGDPPDLTAPALDPRLADVVTILEAARDPDAKGLSVEPMAIESALRAFPHADATSVAHEVCSWVAEGTARTFHASTLLRAALQRRDHKAAINAATNQSRREHPGDARDRELAAMAERFRLEDGE